MKSKSILLALALVVGMSGPVYSGPPPAAGPANPSFESDGATQAPTGWSEVSGTGHGNASFVEAGGHGGSGFRLTHWAATPYTVRTEQRVAGLANGQYTLRVWVRTDGGQNDAYIALRGSGSEQRVAVPRTGGTDWVQVAVST